VNAWRLWALSVMADGPDDVDAETEETVMPYYLAGHPKPWEHTVLDIGEKFVWAFLFALVLWAIATGWWA
jgi:hypothetical protein